MAAVGGGGRGGVESAVEAYQLPESRDVEGRQLVAVVHAQELGLVRADDELRQFGAVVDGEGAVVRHGLERRLAYGVGELAVTEVEPGALVDQVGQVADVQAPKAGVGDEKVLERVAGGALEGDLLEGLVAHQVDFGQLGAVVGDEFLQRDLELGGRIGRRVLGAGGVDGVLGGAVGDLGQVGHAADVYVAQGIGGGLADGRQGQRMQVDEELDALQALDFGIVDLDAVDRAVREIEVDLVDGGAVDIGLSVRGGDGRCAPALQVGPELGVGEVGSTQFHLRLLREQGRGETERQQGCEE